jgi:hypothetical protein
MAGGSGHARAGGTCSGGAVPARWHCTFCRLGGLRSRRFASSRGATFGLCRAVEVRWPRLRERPDALATLDLALYEVANVVVAAWKDRHAARRLRGLIATVPDDGGLIRAEAALLEAAAELALRTDSPRTTLPTLQRQALRGAQLVS